MTGSLTSRSLPAAAAAVIAATTLAGCSSSTSTQAEGNDGAISIVASTPIWADIAQAVADTASVDVEVTSVITDPNVDPHHFEPAAADIAKANDADITVVGGGGYDAWLYQSLQDQATIVTALPLIDHGTLKQHTFDKDLKVQVIDGNEHIWYSLDAINLVAQEVADAINTRNPQAGASVSAVKDKTANYEARLASLRANTLYAQTEPIADYLLAPTTWSDATPQGYRAATLSEGEPAAADLARFLEAIKSHSFEVLIYNPQTETDMTQRIHDAALAASIPVVEIGETPLGGENFFDYYDQVLSSLESALK